MAGAIRGSVLSVGDWFPIKRARRPTMEDEGSFCWLFGMLSEAKILLSDVKILKISLDSALLDS